jgi:assimilatory nitrate reductase catalytic subunit
LRLAAAVSEPFAELPPTLAAHVAIIDGDMMRISSRRASLALRARVTESIRAELIFAPFYWGEGGSINDRDRRHARFALEDAAV